MNWKNLLIIPMAALAAGEPTLVPDLKSGLLEGASLEAKACTKLEEARKFYLWSYAWKEQDTKKSLALAATSWALIQDCNENMEIRKRLTVLFKDLCPVKAGALHQCP